MKTTRGLLAATWFIPLYLLLVVAAFSGCSTVRPELTREEQVFNEQIREQESDARKEKISNAMLTYLGGMVDVVLYGVGNALANAK